MKKFYLFRSNLLSLEYYHEYKDLEIFEKKCHDYYLLFPLWLLKNNYFDEVVIWRLSDRSLPDITFTVENRKFIQRWVLDFKEVLNYGKSTISFFRGGFMEYDKLVRLDPELLGTKLYLGAGKRIVPQYGGVYDFYLMEDERDFNNDKKCIPFYKTASSNIFYPIKNKKIKYDICWPCNWTQIRYKGQEFLIDLISRSKELKQLKIINCGNKPEVGINLCKRYGVNNIEFLGPKTRPELNELLNESRLGLNLSNQEDGCPRISTEILMSGTPLIIKDTVRLLKYFKKKGVVEVNNSNIINKIIDSIDQYKILKDELLITINDDLSFEKINKKNLDLWL